mmetsp:Transcript_13224/g.11705  ORF Transcript_13224/g.11705 Transcript_13224/m.11705 type:complete len:97 (+) Transcript_13224:13-303(+)
MNFQHYLFQTPSQTYIGVIHSEDVINQEYMVYPHQRRDEILKDFIEAGENYFKIEKLSHEYNEPSTEYIYLPPLDISKLKLGQSPKMEIRENPLGN